MKRKWNSETAQAVREITGVHDPVQGAILLAEQFTVECGVTKGAKSLEILASYLDAEIQICPLSEGEAGQLVPPASENDPYLILVNEAHPRRRQNFSACHEMGHLLMPNYSPDNGRLRDWDSLRFNPQHEEEYLCDVAAAEILLPRREFKPRLRGEGLNIDTVFILSHEFDTSLEATLLNVVLSSGADVAGIVWELDYDKTDRAKAATGVLDLGNEWAPVVKQKWRVKKSWTAGAMAEYLFMQRRSAQEDSSVVLAGNNATERVPRSFNGLEILKPTSGEEEFYVESRAYRFRQNPIDLELTTKVLSLVHLNASGSLR